MGSSFEYIVARDLTVKTDCHFDKRFKSYDFSKKELHNIICTCSLYVLNCLIFTVSA
jgi:hypothetical protein